MSQLPGTHPHGFSRHQNAYSGNALYPGNNCSPTDLRTSRKDIISLLYISVMFQVMGHMDVISIISDGFNVYFPMAILAFCLATYFKIGSRLLSMLGFQQFLEDDEFTTDLVDEGRELIKRGDTINMKHYFVNLHPLLQNIRKYIIIIESKHIS